MIPKMDSKFLCMFIPVLGRFYMTEEMRREYEATDPDAGRLKKSVMLLENTLLYFLAGVMYGSLPEDLIFGADLSYFVFLILAVWIVVGPLEYWLYGKNPRWFFVENTPSKREFVWICYQAFWFSVLGYVVGSWLL